MPRLYEKNMATGVNIAAKKVALILLIAVGILVLAPAILLLITRLVGLSMLLVNVLAVPLVLLVLLWFVYRLWGKPYFRAWHIARIRNARYMKEAVTRGKGLSN